MAASEPHPVGGRNRYRILVDRCKHRPFTATIVYVAVVSAFFYLFQGVDLGASALFYSSELGFSAQDNPFLQRVRRLGPHLVKIIAGTCLAVVMLKLVFPERRPLLPLKTPLFLITTLILGPGVVVNLILKNNWGRPRPRMVEQFGGDMPYQPVWVPSSWCETNCSFVSGEASSSIWLMAVVMVLPAAWRMAALLFVVPLTIILSANRVAFGGHFLSDTLISWGLTFLVILAVKWVFDRILTDEGLDAALTKAGQRVNNALTRTGKGIARAAQASLAKFK